MLQNGNSLEDWAERVVISLQMWIAQNKLWNAKRGHFRKKAIAT